MEGASQEFLSAINSASTIVLANNSSILRFSLLGLFSSMKIDSSKDNIEVPYSDLDSFITGVHNTLERGANSEMKDNLLAGIIILDKMGKIIYTGIPDSDENTVESSSAARKGGKSGKLRASPEPAPVDTPSPVVSEASGEDATAADQ